MLNSLCRVGFFSCGGEDGETGLQALDFTPRLQILNSRAMLPPLGIFGV